MKVVILAGGKGLRYNSDVPKALAMIGDKPILHHIIDIYTLQGYNEFIIATGWKKELIENYINNNTETVKDNTETVNNNDEAIKNDYTIDCVFTGEDSNTGKRIKLIEKYIPENDRYFMCTYGDGLANINLNKLLMEYITNKNIAIITAVRPHSQFGILKFNKYNRISKFKEKPKMLDYVNGGFFIFDREIFNYIDINKNEALETDIFKKIIKIDELGAYKHNGFWETLNTQKDEIMLNDLYDKSIANKTEVEWYNIV